MMGGGGEGGGRWAVVQRSNGDNESARGPGNGVGAGEKKQKR